MKLWDPDHGAELASLKGRRDAEVSSVACWPDGKVLAAGAKTSEVELWDLARGTKVASLTGHQRDVTSVALSPDGRFLALGSEDEIIMLWDVANVAYVTIRRALIGRVASVEFSSDAGSWPRRARTGR